MEEGEKYNKIGEKNKMQNSQTDKEKQLGHLWGEFNRLNEIAYHQGLNRQQKKRQKRLQQNIQAIAEEMDYIAHIQNVSNFSHKVFLYLIPKDRTQESRIIMCTDE